MTNGPWEHIQTVQELNHIAASMGDDELTEALDIVIKLIAKPDVPTKAVAPLIVKLSALASSFRMKAKHYMLYNKEGEAAKKKNVYLTMADSLKDLVDSLKYLAKQY